jgi:Ca2+/H+ antiporter, TMEM165/GDT1 family
MDLNVALIAFLLIFLAELPDKTMFANLVLATKGRPLQIWLGAACAFAVHAAIATTFGAILLGLLPHRPLDALVAGMFLFGAVYAWVEGAKAKGEGEGRRGLRHGAVLTAFVVVFVAEWGDLTQVLMANLAARYHSALSVGAGSVLALWGVAGLAVAAGQALLHVVQISTVRKATAVVLLGLGMYTAWLAAR